jgi:hypothetical protein
MGMNVFVGLRYAVWDDRDAARGSKPSLEDVAKAVNELVARGVMRRLGRFCSRHGWARDAVP